MDKEMFVLSVPEECEPLSEAEVARIKEEFERESRGSPLMILPSGATLQSMSGYVTTAQMERLLQLLGLSEQERGFVRAALETDVGQDFFSVLADYLEENGRKEASSRYRQQVLPSV